MPDDVIWFYEQNGSHVGPVPARVVKQKCREGAIAATTLCWQPAFGSTWRPVRSTEFAADLPKVAQPPPLPEPPPARPAAPVSAPQRPAGVDIVKASPNAWGIALAPLAVTIFAALIARSAPKSGAVLDAASFGITIHFCRADKKQLLEAGYYNAPSAWWSLCLLYTSRCV